jgi:hypothetical protein
MNESALPISTGYGQLHQGKNNSDEQLKDAAAHFTALSKSQSTIKKNVESFFASLKSTLDETVKTLRSTILLSIQFDEGTLVISAGERKITIAPGRGAAFDTRLAKPRGKLCGQIFVFGHVSGQNEGLLLTSLRMYEDGLFTDGVSSWDINQPSCLREFVNALLIGHLFESELYWPSEDELPGYLRAIPIIDDVASTEDLAKPCIGFQCAINRTPGSL